MTKAIVMTETGGPEVLKWKDADPGAPGPGQARVRHEAVGLNFIDVYHRTGLYPLPRLPAVPGMEGAGVVVAVGDGVTDVVTGDRVAYAGSPPGAYAEERNIAADRLVRLPDTIAADQAAAMMLKGMTARYLLHGCYRVGSGDTILIHAAAGGVGTIVSQWARHLGARVIGTVGSDEKGEKARRYGCEHPIVLGEGTDLAARVRELTNGRGVDVVYDSIGQTTFMASLDCLRPLGTMVTFGQSSGPIPPLDLREIASRGSLFLTRPSLMDYTAKTEDLRAHARDLFEVVAEGAVTIEIRQRYPLKEAANAHRDLEARKTTGSTVLLP